MLFILNLGNLYLSIRFIGLRLCPVIYIAEVNTEDHLSPD